MKRTAAVLVVIVGVALAVVFHKRGSARGDLASADGAASVLKAITQTASVLAGDSSGKQHEEVRVSRPAAPPPDTGKPVFPAGLVIGGECPPPAPDEPAEMPPSLVPLTVGLTLAHVWRPRTESNDGEYECLLQVTAVTAAYADVTYTCDRGKPVARRRLCRADLHESHFYLTEAGEDQPPVTSGATMFSLSTRSLQELKATTNTALRYIEIAKGWENLKQPLVEDWDGNLHSGRFDRETTQVVINDRVRDVPVLTGIAYRNSRQTSVTVLDNERLPLVLDFSAGMGFRIHYTRISYPTNGELEKHLATDRKVDVYGIYFDFASDRLRPESTPVLDEIAAVLTKNASWKLTINGHTDSVGGDASNLALSRRRSDAVRKALVERYRIDGGRLLTSGYGASQPKAPNDTPEGRSRNRRVELVRQ